MVEKVSITPGVGADIAVDELTINATAVLAERVKIALGADGSYQRDLQAGQAVMANSLSMAIASDQNPVPITDSLVWIDGSPTVSATIYHANDCVGGKTELANAVRVSGGLSKLVSICIADYAAQDPPLNFLFFNSNPTAATLTDHAAPVLSTDISKVVGGVEVPTTAFMRFGANSICSVLLNLPLKASGGTSLWVSLMTPGIPDFLATTDLHILYAFAYT